MFTGLVQDIGEVQRVTPGAMTELWIRTSLPTSDLQLGESIAVEGACLTVVKVQGDAFLMQASPETLRRTTLGALQPGAPVNLERAMRLSDRLGGHLVLGHVDAVGSILRKTTEGGSLVVEVSLPDGLAPFFIEKGSVTVDGVSLTVNTLGEKSFGLALIPETQERTTLAKKAAGGQVNLEADIIGKYVARLLSAGRVPAAPGTGLTLDKILQSGFGS